MNVQQKVNGYRLSAFDAERLDAVVAHLDRLVASYPMRHLHVTIDRVGHTSDCEVRMTLALGKRRLVARERAPVAGTAAQACADILTKKIQLAKERVHRGHGERAIRRAKAGATLPDVEGLRAAAGARDYDAFRDALREAPELLEPEVARRLHQYPTADAFLGDAFFLADVVESAIHKLYERFGDEGPVGVTLHDRLIQQIDPAIEEILAHLRAA